MADPRINPIFGDLNPITPDSDEIILDQSNIGGMVPLHMAMERSLETKNTLSYPLRAICLYSKKIAAGDGFYGAWNLSTNLLGLETQRVYVKARIPEIHASIPIPDVSKSIETMENKDKHLIDMHDVFLGGETRGGLLGFLAGGEKVPSPGDIIMVDFEDRKNHRGGIYLGIAEKGSDSMPDNSDSSATEAHNSSTGTPSTVASSVNTPASAGYPICAADVEDLCPGPPMFSPSFGPEPQETVLVDGTPIAVTDTQGRPFAALFMKMRNAALEDGISFPVNSGFRADDDIDTREAAAACGLTGKTKKGQITLKNQNCPPKNKGGKGVCDPPTSSPGATRGAHRSGYGVDLGGTNPSTGAPGKPGDYRKKACPNGPTKVYQWLVNNAHYFGFVRTVSKERWHWEYRGESGNRFAISMDHWSWDNYFTSGQGQVDNPTSLVVLRELEAPTPLIPFADDLTDDSGYGCAEQAVA